MRIIDADELKQLREDFIAGKIDFITEGDMVDACKTIDAVVVVRCKDCFYSKESNFSELVSCERSCSGECLKPLEHFCSYGERKE